MGVNYNVAKYLERCVNRGVDFSKLATFGHQEFYISDAKRKKLAKEMLAFEGSIDEKYSDIMFRKLGAKQIDIIDISDYEGANIIHDMNTPIPREYYNRFTCIYDGGATEHIFNFPVAITNIMRMLDVGGYYIGVVPSDHVNGHGLYQFGPMLYIQLFCEKNGFELIEIAFNNNPNIGDLWVAKNPTSHCRMEINSKSPMMIYVLAKKKRDYNEEVILYEGYYQDMWARNREPVVSRYKKAPTMILMPFRMLKNEIHKIRQKSIRRNAVKILCEKIIL